MAPSLSAKHLDMFLGSCLNFNEHVQRKTNKYYKITGLIKKLYQYTYQEKHYFGFTGNLLDLT